MGFLSWLLSFFSKKVEPKAETIVLPPIVTRNEVAKPTMLLPKELPPSKNKILNAIVDAVLTGDYEWVTYDNPNIIHPSLMKKYPHWQAKIMHIGRDAAKIIKSMWKEEDYEGVYKYIVEAFRAQLTQDGKTLVLNAGKTINGKTYATITELFRQLLWMDMKNTEKFIVYYGLTESEIREFLLKL